MRRCPYCAMLSDSTDVCEWCKRSFSSHRDVLSVQMAKPEPKKRKAPNNFTKSVIAVAAIVVAVFALAHVKTTPDGARLTERTAIPTPHFPPPTVDGKVVPNYKANTTTQQTNASRGKSWTETNVSASASGTTSGATASSRAAGQADPAVHMSGVHISTTNDGNGHETAVGTLTIENPSSSQLTDFTILLSVNGTSVPLTPFTGNVTYPMPLESKTIPPHGSLQVSVTSSSPYAIGELAARSISISARFEGTGQTASDQAYLGAVSG